jgi:cobalt-zinc-cadmium efflux system outer membrane protein
VALQRLANNWGSESADFGRAEGQLASTNHLPSPGDLSVHLDSNPDIARWATEMTRREALANIARANAVPDLTIGAGVSRLESGDETGALVNFSIPLPLRNRNQGNIAAAQTRVSKGDRESLSAKIDVRAVFLEAYGRLTCGGEIEALRRVLPAAQRGLPGNERSVARKIRSLNVLDAQRRCFATRPEIINVRADFQKAKCKSRP